MNQFKYTINGNTYDVSIDRFEGDQAEVVVNGTTYKVEIEREVRQTKVVRKKVVTGGGPQPARMKPAGGLGDVKSPLPGIIKDVQVKEGDEVKQGQCVAILEAMKMENEVYASTAGKITKIHVAAGQSVLEGDVLVSIGA
ncbi:biotin/lipoyl-binding protein [bacterium]|nr:biotin/lipoyl-binding protein [bacterium]